MSALFRLISFSCFDWKKTLKKSNYLITSKNVLTVNALIITFYGLKGYQRAKCHAQGNVEGFLKYSFEDVISFYTKLVTDSEAIK